MKSREREYVVWLADRHGKCCDEATYHAARAVSAYGRCDLDAYECESELARLAKARGDVLMEAISAYRDIYAKDPERK